MRKSFEKFLARQEALARQYGEAYEEKQHNRGKLTEVISKLRSYEDRTLRAEIQDSPEEMLKLVEKYFHCG